MFRHLNSNNFLFRLLIGSFIIVGSFLLLSVILTSADRSNVGAQSANLSYNDLSDNMPDYSNVVTASLSNITNEISSTSYQVKDGAKKSLYSVETFSKAISKTSMTFINTTANTTKTSIYNATKIVKYISFATVNAMSHILNLPIKAITSIANMPLIKKLVRPSSFAEVQQIDPNSPELLAALSYFPPTINNTSNQINQMTNLDGPIWPINGQVTTNFGVPHRPFQTTHTGLDISDGKRSGTTPVKPFRSGKVVATSYERGGYGNHVVIDHGNGLTSVYAHLDSITVKINQDVNIDNTIGYEGTTGLSTGTHLHFEIRINNKVTDPHKFISGNPY